MYVPAVYRLLHSFLLLAFPFCDTCYKGAHKWPRLKATTKNKCRAYNFLPEGVETPMDSD